jgi:hypothetical protein
MPISYDATIQAPFLPANSVFLNPPRNQAITQRARLMPGRVANGAEIFFPALYFQNF